MVIHKIIKYYSRLLLSNCTMPGTYWFCRFVSFAFFVTYSSRHSLLTSEGKSSIFFFLESRISSPFFVNSQRIWSDCFSWPSFDVSLACGILSLVMDKSWVEHSCSSTVPGTISIRCPTLPETNVSSKGHLLSTVKHAWPSRDNFLSSLSIMLFYSINLYLYSTLTTM